MSNRQRAGDESVLDDLVAKDMMNHAAGPEGREGLREILRIVQHDLGPVTMLKLPRTGPCDRDLAVA